MAGNLIEIGMLLTVAVTAAAFVRRPVPWRACAIGVVVWAVGVSIAFPAFADGRMPPPMHVLAVTSFCAVQAFCLATPLCWSRVVPVLFTWLMTMALLAVAMRMIHSGGYTTRSYTYDHKSQSLHYLVQDIGATDTHDYQPGWVTDEPFAVHIHAHGAWSQREIPHPFWHSRFTGLYRLERKPVAAWFTGGRLTKDHITFRERPGVIPPR